MNMDMIMTGCRGSLDGGGTLSSHCGRAKTHYSEIRPDDDAEIEIGYEYP